MTAPVPPLTPLDFVGAVGLGLSVVSLSWQGVNQFRRRRRVSVEVTDAVQATSVAEGILNERILVVTIRNTGAATGIDNVFFELEDPPSHGVNWSRTPTGGPPPRWGGPFDIELLLSMQGERRVLQDGEVAASGYRCTVQGYKGMDRPRDVRAVVTLASGKKIRSRYFTLGPDQIFPTAAD